MHKSRISIAVIGHTDAGKSMTTGHLIYKCGGYDRRVIERFEKNAALSSIKYAWFREKLTAHREDCNDCRITLNNIETTKFHFTIIDTLGDKKFINNMISGAAHADVALLVVSAREGEFEIGMASEGQTREHALLAYTFGLKQMIVCVNKMDHEKVNWSQSRFEQIQKEVSDYLKKIGYNPDKIPFIPLSAWQGDNILDKSPNLLWFKGPTLIEALDSLTPIKRPVDKPLRIAIRDFYKIPGVGAVAVGRVVTGVLKPGMTVRFALSGVNAEVRSIEMHHEPLKEAVSGDSIGFHIKNIGLAKIKRGDICGDAYNDPPKEVVSFYAQIVVLNHPGEIRVGYCPLFYCHIARVACKFVEIKEKIDIKTGAVLEKEPQSIKSGDCAIVKLVPVKPICVEEFKAIPQLGRFAIRDFEKTVGVGIIKSVEKKTE